MLRTSLVRMTHSILRDPSVRAALWDVVQRGEGLSRARPAPVNPWGGLWRRAGRQTVDYIEQHMLTAPVYEGRKPLLREALGAVGTDGLYLEFGAGWKAESIRFLAGQMDGTVHGFDSLQGLPEDWFGHNKAGSHSSGNQRPALPENAKLHVGWFDEVLPRFLAQHPGNAAFIHIDCDVYSSTRTVFDLIGERIVPGSVIQFDEYFNYPGWQQHEFRAFQEFIADSGLDYSYLGYTTQFAVAVRIEGPAEGRRVRVHTERVEARPETVEE